MMIKAKKLRKGDHFVLRHNLEFTVVGVYCFDCYCSVICKYSKSKHDEYRNFIIPQDTEVKKIN